MYKKYTKKEAFHKLKKKTQINMYTKKLSRPSISACKSNYRQGSHSFTDKKS